MLRTSLPMVLAGLLLSGRLGAQTGLTIYNDGRVLVRRTLPSALPAGVSTHQLAAGPLDPGSLFSLDPEVTVVGSRFDASVDEANTMRRAVGRKVVFETGVRNGVADTVVAEVLAVDPERFRVPGGAVVFQRPGRPRYPDDLVRLEPTIEVAVRAAAARPALSLGYFTGGASWSAAYQVVLARGSARVAGHAVIPSQQLSAGDAEIQLLAGETGRARPEFGQARAMEMAAAPQESATSEEVGEAHLYTLPGRHTLSPGVTTTGALFDPAATPWERGYVVRGHLPWVGPLMQYGEEGDQRVEVHYLLRRQARTGFGDAPLPAGTWRLFEADAAGRLQLVGEAAGRHTPAGQDLRLPAGSAFDLTARRVQTEYATRRDSLRTRATAGYRITVTNAKDTVVTVDVLEERRGEWRVLSSSVPADQLSATQTRFRLRVPARGEAEVTYRVQVIW